MVIMSSFLLQATVSGRRSTTLEASVSIGVLRLSTTTATTRTASTSIVAIATCTTAAVTTVFQCVQS